MTFAKQWTLIGAVILAAGAASAADSLTPYTAVYSVEYKGKQLGTAEFKLTFDEGRGVYEFSNRTEAKGFIKLARPNPVVDRSQFRVDGNRLLPIEYWYEDGSRKGDDNLHIVFDWTRKIATVTSGDGRRELALQDGAFDRNTIEVALMRDLATTGKPGRYLVVDEDSVQPYEYVDNGETTIPTGMGPLAARAFVQHRDGSSRVNTIWMVPKLGFLPARIEQKKDGEVTTAFLLVSVKGITAR